MDILIGASDEPTTHYEIDEELHMLPLRIPLTTRRRSWQQRAIRALSRTLSAAIVVAPGAMAQAPLVPRTLPELLAYALRANPDLRTARLRADSAHGELRISRAIPNPTFTVAPGTPFQYSVTQLVDIGPARLFRTRAARKGLEASSFHLRESTRQVTYLVAQGFYDLLLAEAVRDVSQAQRDIFRRLLAADSLRLQHGDLALRDVATTELQASRTESALARTTAAARVQRVFLQVLVGITVPDTAFRAVGSLDFGDVSLPMDTLESLASHQRTDLAGARVRLEQSHALRSLARANLVPVPVVSGVYQKDPFPNGANSAVGIGLTVPVFNWFGGERERARAGEQAAEIAVQRSEVQVRSDLAVAVENYRAARQLADRYTTGRLLEHSRAAVEMQRFAYQQGAASLIELLAALSAFNDIQTDYYTALHDYWVSVHAVNSAVGGGLLP